MPARSGAQQHTVTLDDQLSAQLLTLTARAEYKGSKSAVVTEALRLLIEGTTSETVIAGLQQQISLLHATMQERSQALLEAVGRLHQDVQALTTRVHVLATPRTEADGNPPEEGPRKRWRLWETTP